MNWHEWFALACVLSTPVMFWLSRRVCESRKPARIPLWRSTDVPQPQKNPPKPPRPKSLFEYENNVKRVFHGHQ